MKILGLSCGRRMSNTEILVKEALMGAEEAGAEVEIVRLMDLDLKPCTGCNSCVIDIFEHAGSGKCVIKDDLAWIDEKILECDGIIVGSPIYEKGMSGYLKTLNDRMGPSHDMAFRLIAKKIRAEKGITKGTGPDERSFKPRAAALFAVGGSDWTELAVPMLQIFALPMQMTVLDQHLFNWIALPGVVTLHDDMLARARKTGAHMAESLKADLEKAEYIGDEGLCPVCHAKILQISGSNASCAVCGVKGTLVEKNGEFVFTATEEAKAHSQVRLSGKFMHAEDLNTKSLRPPENMHEVRGRLEKYKSYLTYSKPEKKAE
jgi:multimeric flavodoxin WrbA